ncbi:Light-independent protochlorophyllide reductase subunit N [Bienertia sinuspersici]
MTNNPFGMEALKNTMKIAWRLGREVVVREIEHNLFIFQFFSPMDKANEVDHGIQPSEIVFDTIRFWVKVEDMQLNKRTRAMAISLAASMGEFVDFDDSDPIGWSKYMRFRVDIKLDKPLKRFTRIATQGEVSW